MIQLIQVAGGDVYAVNREGNILIRYARTIWQNPYVRESACELHGFLEAKVGEPFKYRSALGWRQAPVVQRMAWMLETASIEESLYAAEWLEGFEQFFHRGVHANNPYPKGLQSYWWTKGYDNAARQT